MMLLPVVVIGLIVWLVVSLSRRGDINLGSSRRSALDIARERYARGEISREQFEQIKRDITG